MKKRYQRSISSLKQRLRVVFVSALCFAISSLVGARAEDTSIYVNSPVSVDSNILFMLDSSGSMTENVGGSNETRMDAVKSAMTNLIDKQGNLNMGLGRFHYYLGAPIIFPITPLNSAPDFITEEIAVSTVGQSADDAEELDNGSMLLTDTRLDMAMTTAATPPSGLVDTWVSDHNQHSRNDNQWEEGQGSGSTDLDVGDLHLAVRFRQIDIPRNATILSAEIEFTGYPQELDDETRATIYALDLDDAPELDQWFIDDDYLFDNRTDESVEWSNIFELGSGEKTSTPNLRTLVQAIVTRSGWNPFQEIAFFFRERDGQRTFYPHGSGSDSPVLRITYAQPGVSNLQITVEDDDDDAEEELNGGDMLIGGTRLGIPEDNGQDQAVGVRFNNVDIPQGSTIIWADVRFTVIEDEGDWWRYGEDAHFSISMDDRADAPPFSSSDGDITSRPTSLLVPPVDWQPVLRPDEEHTLLTPDLSALVNDVIQTDVNWTPGNALAFIFEEGGFGFANGIRALCARDAVNSNNCPGISSAPTLNIWYAPPEPGSGDPVGQTVGLRFNELAIPQGAVIESAHLEFRTAAVSTTPGMLDIQVEESTNAEPYSADSNNISGRTYHGPVEWNTEEDPWDTIGETKQSVDVSTLVSHVTGNAGWCGGNALAFKITGADTHVIADSWDQSPASAPVLRVEFDTSGLNMGQGCVKRRTISLITTGTGDIEEESDGDIRFSDDTLDVINGRHVGFRFEGIEIPNGATVTNATLTVSAYDDDGGSLDMEIDAQQHPNPPGFTSADEDLTSRMSGTEKQDGDVDPVEWDEDDTWTEGENYSTDVNLSPLIADIINGNVEFEGETWASGNALVFSVRKDSGWDRIISSVNINTPTIPKRPAELTIEWQANLGDVELPPVSTRQSLKQTVNDIQPRGFTPTVDSIFESLSYFTSSNVHFGRTRGAGVSYEETGPTTDSDLDSDIVEPWWQGGENWEDDELLRDAEFGRLSHPQTYVDAGQINPATDFGNSDTVDPSSFTNSITPTREGACTELNPNHPDCRTERIEPGAQYKSPFVGAGTCEKGFLILLSDGIANRNSSRDLIQSITGDSFCSLDIPEIDDDTGEVELDGDGTFDTRNPSSDEMCGLEAAKYLYDRDFIDGPNSDNNVKTFTIGFDLPLNSSSNRDAVEFLKALAFIGNGGNIPENDSEETGVSYGDGFYTAGNAEELQLAFEDILAVINEETTSFVAPGLAVNAFNRLFNRDDVYFSLFRASESIGWLGNVKKFKLCTETGEEATCEFGEVIDASGNSAVNDDIGNLETFGTLKANAEGFWSGEGDSAPEIDQGGAGEAIPTYLNRNVYLELDEGNPIPDTDAGSNNNERGTAPEPIEHGDDVGPLTSPLNEVKQTLVDAGNCPPTDNTCLDDLIEWMLGLKNGTNDLPRDHTNSDDTHRWAFADPMHSRPLVLTYGMDSSDDSPISKLFVGTNDGGLRMLNEDDGAEGWIFYPNSMLGNTSSNSFANSGKQALLRDNDTGSHIYGIDDTPVARVNDQNLDGIIQPATDFVHVYVGMRRGGDQLYAINATPDSAITTKTQANPPNIKPEILWRIDGSDADFGHLGQTWSTPRPVRVLGPEGPRTVLIFGGGYSTEQDGANNDGVAADGGDVYNTENAGDSEGNAIYIVDADTGERIWWASSDEDADLVLEDMNTSIAAPVTLLDSNGDSFSDRIYAVDLRGQVFRVDLQAMASPPEGDESELGNSTGGLLARLGDDDPQHSRRKFLYAPSVSEVNDELVGGGKYEAIAIVSGNRVNPQGQTTLDRAYGIRDYLVDEPIAGDGSNFPACNANVTAATCSGAKTEPIQHPDDPENPDVDLVNVTAESEFVIRQENEDGSISLVNTNGDPATVLSQLEESYGWFFDLPGNDIGAIDLEDLDGEKGFSTASVLDGKMFFTTYLPPGEEEDTGSDTEEACSAPGALGTSRLYAVDVFTGSPVFEFFNGDTGFQDEDRFKDLGAGPSSDVVPAHLEPGVTLVVPTGGAAVAQDPGITNRAFKSFWFEEQ